jgi:hypothetical protein
MRDVKISVGGTPIGEQQTWAYPNGGSLGTFLIPVYPCWVEGTDANRRYVRERFEVLRFGVECKDGRTAHVVGLADFQSHVIRAWLPKYTVHSAPSEQDGAWQVYDSFLIHAGPEESSANRGHASVLFATIGRIEIMGPRGFWRFNDLVISLAGPKSACIPEQLQEIARSGHLKITYSAAKRPPLKQVSHDNETVPAPATLTRAHDDARRHFGHD